MFASYKKAERAKPAKKTAVKTEEKKTEPAAANLKAKRTAAAPSTAPKSQEVEKEATNLLITDKTTPEILIETP